MFTGIVQAIGNITAVTAVQTAWDAQGTGLRLTIDAAALDLGDVAIGDSIAINGACMTVVELMGSSFRVDISRESLSRTAGLDRMGPVNLEKAMRAGDRLGGHMVSGHVDGTAGIKEISPVGESHRLVATIPPALSAYVTEKGSIALDGVSLTINAVQDHGQGCDISVNLIPHTWQSTTLQLRRAGERLNVEVDQLAKQVERILQHLHPAA